MSVFGGDSWGREAQHRKRRIQDVIVHHLNNNDGDGESSNSYKKLCNGKYACLICPDNPVLDSLLILSMHNQGARHIAAESRRQEEINRRIALSDGSFPLVKSQSVSKQNSELKDKPLIEQTRKVTTEILGNKMSERSVVNVGFDKGKNASFFSRSLSSSSSKKQRTELLVNVESETCGISGKKNAQPTEEAGKMLSEQQLQLELLNRRERELKFTAAGWKRDGHGGWFKDENVEFDSDEEDPNVCL
ncbi:hypothetical protein GIB67_019633 [Kingdonia uniflora]|uniref:Sodium channel modifier 1 n=1 Tax=Kingdonia uniflora TaxID=39325 RepID=A0A7J7N0N3_9MAGN|nr:hypothetical protein GIB67_019633 [Kingdonia uniflora]